MTDSNSQSDEGRLPEPVSGAWLRSLAPAELEAAADEARGTRAHETVRRIRRELSRRLHQHAAVALHAALLEVTSDIDQLRDAIEAARTELAREAVVELQAKFTAIVAMTANWADCVDDDAR